MTARKDNPSAAARIRVMKRDRFQCTYCGRPGTDAELEVDHVIPVADGGSHHISNLTTACRKCNQNKGTKRMTPQTSHVSGDHPLLKMFLHTLKEGRIHNQGQVIGVDGDTCLVQLFSFMDGRPTEVRPMAKVEVYECKLYKTQDEWVRAHLLEMQRDGTLEGGVEYNLECWRKYA